MRRYHCFGLAAAATCLPVAAIAREPVVLKPLSPWNLRYDPENCKLVRAFGDAKKPTVMVLERLAPDSSMSLMVFGGGLFSRIGAQGVTASFLPFDSNRFEAGPVAQTNKDKGAALYWTNVTIRPQDLTDKEKKERDEAVVRDLRREAEEQAIEDRTATGITALRIRENGRETILETGSMGKAYPLMRQCGRDQLLDWGIDPAVHDKIVRRARTATPLLSLIRDDDYPEDAIRMGDESVIRARLLIDASGAVTKCTSLSVYSAPSFGDVVCKRFRLAKFSPAQLADGTRVPDFTTANIRFVIPRD